MIQFIKDMKVGHKLYFVMGISILIFVGVVLYSVITLNENSKISTEADLARTDYINLKSLEKEFIQLGRTEDDYYARLDESLLDDYNSQYGIAVQNLESLHETDKELLDQIKEFRKGLEAYKTDFEKSVEVITQLGVNENEGLQGTLRRSIHALEARISQPRDLVKMLMLRRHEKDFLLRHDRKYLKEFDDVATPFLESLKDEEDRQFLSDYIKEFHAYTDAYLNLLEIKEQHKEAALKIIPSLNVLYEAHQAEMEEWSNEVHVNQARLRSTLVDMCIVCVIVCIVFAFIFTSLIKNSLKKCVDFTIKLGQGILDERVDLNQKDEFGQMAGSLNAMAEQLGQLIKSIRNDSEVMDQNANDMLASSSDTKDQMDFLSQKVGEVLGTIDRLNQVFSEISENTTQNTDRIQAIATATEEMTITVNEIARNADDTRNMSNSAVEIAAKSSDNTVELSDHAKAIQDVISSIVEIAEQTKLLALNATIEAARAGEAGKGFAVVAGEVKDLAAQSNQASEAIKAKIEAITQATVATTGLFQEVQSKISQSNDMVVSIASAVEEQAVTNKEIAESIEETRGTTHFIAQSIESTSGEISNVVTVMTELADIGVQASASSDNAQKQAQDFKSMSTQMKESVARFQV